MIMFKKGNESSNTDFEFHTIKLDFEESGYFLIDSGSAVNTISNKLGRNLQENFKTTSRKILTANNSSLHIWIISISNNRGAKIKENYNIVVEENCPPIFSGDLGKEFLKRNSCSIIYKPEENYFLMKEEKIPLNNYRKIENYYMHSLCGKERDNIVTLSKFGCRNI